MTYIVLWVSILMTKEWLTLLADLSYTVSILTIISDTHAKLMEQEQSTAESKPESNESIGKK